MDLYRYQTAGWISKISRNLGRNMGRKVGRKKDRKRDKNVGEKEDKKVGGQESRRTRTRTKRSGDTGFNMREEKFRLQDIAINTLAKLGIRES